MKNCRFRAFGGCWVPPGVWEIWQSRRLLRDGTSSLAKRPWVPAQACREGPFCDVRAQEEIQESKTWVRASDDGRAGARRAQGVLGPAPLFYNEETEIKHVVGITEL